MLRGLRPRMSAAHPRELPTEGSQNDLLHLHGALHSAGGVGHGHLLGDQFSPDACLERSFHVSLGSGQIMCSLQDAAPRLDRLGRRSYSPPTQTARLLSQRGPPGREGGFTWPCRDASSSERPPPASPESWRRA